jgi:hypothetical protein
MTSTSIAPPPVGDRPRRAPFAAAAGFVLLATASAGSLACSTCGCTLSTDWASQGLTIHEGWSADLRYDYYDQDQLRSGTHSVDRGSITYPAAEEIQQNTVNRNATLSFDYGNGTDWGVTVQLPWLDRYHTTIDAGETEVSTARFKDVGDVRVVGRWLGLSEAQDWGLEFGVKLPTGRTDVTFESGPTAGEALDRGLQPGTGSTDLLLGAFRYGTFGDDSAPSAVDWFGVAQAQIPILHDDAFRPGTGVNLSTGVRWRGAGAIVPEAQLNARFEQRESGSEADVQNSGATLLYVSPGVSWAATPRVGLYAFAQLPVYQRVNGLQLEPRWSVSAGVRASF